MVFRVGLFLPFVISALLASRVAAAGEDCEIIYVAKGHTNPVNDGSSWANAFCDDTALADGIAAAAARMDGLDPPPCVDVYVAAGVYKPSDSGASFSMHDKVHLYGGFKVGDDFSMRQTGCLGGGNAGRPCETADDCPGGTCDLERVTTISGDINDDDGAPCQEDAVCGAGNSCVGSQCLIGPNRGALIIAERIEDATLDGFVIKFGRGTEGSAIHVRGEPTLCPDTGPTIRHCLIRNNYSAYVGATSESGAICSHDALLTVEGCVFRGNEASGHGAAIASRAGRINVVDSLFLSNRTKGDLASGGAIFVGAVPYCAGTPSRIEGCEFEDNKSPGINSGGAIDANGVLVLSRCSFGRNSAGYAGAVASGGPLLVDDCEFVENTATAEVGDGAITGGVGDLHVSNSRFVQNFGGFSGAISWQPGSSQFEKSVFYDNVGGATGAIYQAGTGRGSITFREVLFAGNTTAGGPFNMAAAVLFEGDDLICDKCRFLANGEGTGTILLSHGEAQFVNSLFAGNSAPVVFLDPPNTGLALTNCTVTKNHYGNGRGALSLEYVREHSDVIVANSILWNNSDADPVLDCTDEIHCGQSCSCAGCAPGSPCLLVIRR